MLRVDINCFANVKFSHSEFLALLHLLHQLCLMFYRSFIDLIDEYSYYLPVGMQLVKKSAIVPAAFSRRPSHFLSKRTTWNAVLAPYEQ